MLKTKFDELYNLSITNPEKIWYELAQELVWSRPYDSVIDDSPSPIRNWFVGGEINISYNCLDRHVQDGFGDDIAIIYESPDSNTKQRITYKQLLHSVELVAGVLVQKCGIKKGDRVLFYFPVIPEGMIGMLACARIGAIYSAVFGGFAPKAFALRIQQTEATLIMTCNVGYEQGEMINFKERVDIAIEESSFKPEYCIVYNRPNTMSVSMQVGRDLDWKNEIDTVRPQAPIPVESNHPLFIIYTSGTTGEPKGLVIGTGGTAVGSKYQIKYILQTKPSDIVWMFSDFGWITGQIVMIYGALLNRCSTVLYEGHYSNEIPKIISETNAVKLICSPSIMRIFRKNCSELNLAFTFSELKTIFIGGETSDQDLKDWISNTFSCTVYNIWGQTEVGGCGIGPAFGSQRRPESHFVPLLGIAPKVVHLKEEDELPNEQVGRILFKVPLPPYSALTIYKDHERFLKTYFTNYPGYFDTMDCGAIMKDGSLQVISRIDDIIHVSSVRLSGSTVEEIILKNKNIISAAVVPIDDPLVGQVPFAFLILQNNHESSEKEIIDNVIDLVKENCGEFALFDKVVIVPDFPKTKSGKVSRYSLSSMVNGKEYKVPATVTNTEIYQLIYDALVKAGYRANLPIDL